MTFDIFESVTKPGQVCTKDLLLEVTRRQSLIPLYNQIAAEEDGDKRQALKRNLPGVTWQAHFPNGRRKNGEGEASGLFMVDIDHIDNPYQLYNDKLAARIAELGIKVVHETPSRKGLRVVCLCRPECKSIAENQAWFKAQTGLDIDAATKDEARFSYLVPADYFYFFDNEIWDIESTLNSNSNANEKENSNSNSNSNPSNFSNLSNFSNAYGTTSYLQPAADNAGAGSADSVSGSSAVNKTTEYTEYTENNLNHESHESTRISQSSGQDSGNSVVEKEKIREDSCNSWLNNEPYLYRGKTLREIAEAYVSHFGSPVQGERHTYYYRMCAYFKYICDCDKAVLLDELPDFGLTMAERRSECDHACSKPTGGSIPKEFYFFLKSLSLVPSPKGKGEKTAEELDAELDAMFAEEESQQHQLPFPSGEGPGERLSGERLPFPPIFSSFARISPSDFVLPQTYVIMPTLGALLHVRAQYLDGKYHTPTFHNVIYAPAGTGKSYARATVERLTKHIAKRDKENELLELANQDAKQKAKNKKEQPESVVLPKRRQMGTFSQPKLLKRQRANGDMHTLVYLEEIDTLMKSKRGYGGMDLSDMFRVAFDNATYSQDVVCDTTFNGEVDLFLNFCITGTEDQLMRCYKNPDDGLVTRIGLCPIKNQEYAETPIWKCLTKKDNDIIEACLDFADTLTYETDDEGVEHILERTDITEEMQFMHPVLNAWLEEKRMQALKSQDRALDIFRRRVAVKMFRLAMVCWGCYCGKLNADREALIKEFCLWWGEQDLQNLLDKYGEMVVEKKSEKHVLKEDLFAMLPDTFTSADVESLRLANNVLTPTRVIICFWKQAGLIRKELKTFVKCS